MKGYFEILKNSKFNLFQMQRVFFVLAQMTTRYPNKYKNDQHVYYRRFFHHTQSTLTRSKVVPLQHDRQLELSAQLDQLRFVKPVFWQLSYEIEESHKSVCR